MKKRRKRWLMETFREMSLNLNFKMKSWRMQLMRKEALKLKRFQMMKLLMMMFLRFKYNWFWIPLSVSGNLGKGIPKVSKGRFNSFQIKLDFTYFKDQPNCLRTLTNSSLTSKTKPAQLRARIIDEVEELSDQVWRLIRPSLVCRGFSADSSNYKLRNYQVKLAGYTPLPGGHCLAVKRGSSPLSTPQKLCFIVHNGKAITRLARRRLWDGTNASFYWL